MGGGGGGGEGGELPPPPPPPPPTLVSCLHWGNKVDLEWPCTSFEIIVYIPNLKLMFSGISSDVIRQSESVDIEERSKVHVYTIGGMLETSGLFLVLRPDGFYIAY